MIGWARLLYIVQYLVLLQTIRKLSVLSLDYIVMPYNNLGEISGNLYPNNQNNQLEKRAQPPRDVL